MNKSDVAKYINLTSTQRLKCFVDIPLLEDEPEEQALKLSSALFVPTCMV